MLTKKPRAVWHSAISALRTASRKEDEPLIAVSQNPACSADHSRMGVLRAFPHTRASNGRRAIALSLVADFGRRATIAYSICQGHVARSSTSPSKEASSSRAAGGGKAKVPWAKDVYPSSRPRLAHRSGTVQVRASEGNHGGLKSVKK